MWRCLSHSVCISCVGCFREGKQVPREDENKRKRKKSYCFLPHRFTALRWASSVVASVWSCCLLASYSHSLCSHRHWWSFFLYVIPTKRLWSRSSRTVSESVARLPFPCSSRFWVASFHMNQQVTFRFSFKWCTGAAVWCWILFCSLLKCDASFVLSMREWCYIID